ncbi:hypothetical protein SFC07_11165 [Corynebacterium callunae]|uniref:hypothetical protein n=1 Tax=Corynebacterium callunae TaxID=1721 RepID=UPI0039825CBB
MDFDNAVINYLVRELNHRAKKILPNPEDFMAHILAAKLKERGVVNIEDVPGIDDLIMKETLIAVDLIGAGHLAVEIGTATLERALFLNLTIDWRDCISVEKAFNKALSSLLPEPYSAFDQRIIEVFIDQGAQAEQCLKNKGAVFYKAAERASGFTTTGMKLQVENGIAIRDKEEVLAVIDLENAIISNLAAPLQSYSTIDRVRGMTEILRMYCEAQSPCAETRHKSGAWSNAFRENASSASFLLSAALSDAQGVEE